MQFNPEWDKKFDKNERIIRHDSGIYARLSKKGIKSRNNNYFEVKI